MYHNILKEGAFVIADAHYSKKLPHFLTLLKKIDSKELNPTQLILLGDIFDALFGGVKESYDQEAIKLLNKLSYKLDIIYLEGNHDFNLKNIFPNIKIYKRQMQPVIFEFNNKKVAMSHGDIFMDNKIYNIYSVVIRNSFILKSLSLLNRLFNGFILKKLDTHLSKKDNCKKIDNFKNIVIKRVAKLDKYDYFVEGHFHQNISFELENLFYINIGAFACNQRYFIVKSAKDNINLFKEVVLEE